MQLSVRQKNSFTITILYSLRPLPYTDNDFQTNATWVFMMSAQNTVRQAIQALEAQRGIIDDAILEASIAALHEQLKHTPPPESRSPANTMTVLYAALSSNLSTTDSSATGKILSALLAINAELKAVVEKYGAAVDPSVNYDLIARFEGDDPQKTAHDAVMAALELLIERRAISARQIEKVDRRIPFTLHIGIHTGDSVMQLGKTSASTKDQRADTDWHILNALHKHTAPNTILVSQQTYRYVRETFAIHDPESVEVESISQTITAYRVERVRSHPITLPLPTVSGVTANLIGRNQELDQLKTTFRKVLGDQSCQTFTVIGATGIGKSRLVYEFVEWLESLPDLVWHFAGHAMPESRRQPFALLRRILANYFNINVSDTQSQAKEKLLRGMREFFGDDDLYKAHFIGHLIGLDFSDSPVLHGILHDARQIHDNAFHYFFQFIRAVIYATDRPAVIAVEDIHTADEGSLALLGYLINHGENLPLMIVFTAQPQLSNLYLPWRQSELNSHEINLAPLSERATNILVSELLRNVSDAPPQLLDHIVKRSGGNPNLVEEYIRLLIKDGIIMVDEDRWSVDIHNLPDDETRLSFQTLVEARTQQLSEYEIEILQFGAIIGTQFWDQAVAHLADESDPSVPRIAMALESLVRQNLIIPQEKTDFSDAVEYRFSHVRLQQWLLETIPSERRQSAHAQTAAWLIGRSFNRVGSQAAVIADHFLQSGEIERAIKWFGLAARQARDVFAPEMAIIHYERALQCMEEGAYRPRKRIELLDGLGLTLVEQHRYAEAHGVFENLIKTAAQIGDNHSQIRAWNALSDAQIQSSDPHAAVESAIQAEDLARSVKIDVKEDMMRAYLNQSRAWMQLAELDRAADTCERALTLVETIDNQESHVEVHSQMGYVYANAKMPDYGRAINQYNVALAFARELGDLWHTSAIAQQIAELAFSRGDYQIAHLMYETVHQVAEEIGDRHAVLRAIIDLSATWNALGEHKTAWKILNRQLGVIEREDSPVMLSTALANGAEALHGIGEAEDALVMAYRALEIAYQLDNPATLGQTWRTLGIVAATIRFPLVVNQKAVTPDYCFDEGLQVALNNNLPFLSARIQRSWAAYEIQFGNQEYGESMWSESRDQFATLGADIEVDRMKVMPTRSQ
jgi:predicted ATPase/class 3 adenylate cyclase